MGEDPSDEWVEKYREEMNARDPELMRKQLLDLIDRMDEFQLRTLLSYARAMMRNNK